jgi:hypothetical protein
MRTAELILMQPDGKVRRLVVESDVAFNHEDSESYDQSLIASLCDAMMDQEFRSKLAEVEEESKQKLKALWQV